MKKLLAILIVLVFSLGIAVPMIALAQGPTVTDTYMPVMADQSAPEPAYEAPVAAETDPGGIDLTQIIQALIGLLAALVTVYLLPWIKAKTSQRQYDLLMNAIGIGVNAAEGLYKSGNGSKKMAYVMEYLRRNGFKVDEAEIESMVYRILNQYKQEVSSDG